jgi:hypothetical protein
MNTKQLNIILLILLSGCSSNSPSTIEEVEYQNYASVRRSEPKIPAGSFEKSNKTYIESGLQEFIYNTGDYVNKQDKTLNDLDEFYQKVINGKYAKHEEQENLRIKFIGYAVSAFGLTQMENVETTQYLIKYTRELAKNDHSLDAGLSYKCLSSIRGLVDKEEYKAMVKKAKFQTRFFIELFQETLSTSRESDPKEPFDQLREQIEISNQYLSDFEALIN